MIRAPLDFQKWIEDHRHLLKPPVGNQVVYKDSEFIIMVVGGPNSRTDYHVNQGEEFFYQLEGDICLKVIDEGQHRDIYIKAGQIFLLPPNVPHSPRRPANTVGLVIERQRHADELDGFQWYCPDCGHKLYEEFVAMTDIVAQLPPIFERFYGDLEHRSCKECACVVERPE